MKKSLKTYLEQHAPRKNASKLLPFYSEMLSMREQGYSYWQLSEALQENGIKAYPSEIKRFMDRKINKVESAQKIKESKISDTPNEFSFVNDFHQKIKDRK
jgi:superfamily II helicase